MSVKKILVTGATGKQGGAVIKAILAKPLPFDYQILALTRNTTSASAAALASNPNVELISGDLNDCNAIFEKAGGRGSIWGVYLVTVPDMKKKGGEDLEVKQGKNLVDASVLYDAKHVVFSSVDRGGNEASDVNATDIGHFVSKYHIENHLKAKSTGTGMTWTILRPVAFLENLMPNLFGRVFAAMWQNMGDKKLQLVATRDIGLFAAQAFAGNETDEFKNASISLAGDEVTQAQANEIFWKVKGRPMPRAYSFMGTLLQKAIPEVGTMFKWFVDVGYGADITHCKKLNGKMLDFETWLKEESAFKR